MSNNLRETYLRFLARLYELASDFDQRQLAEIRRVADDENRKLVSGAVALLKDLGTGRRNQNVPGEQAQLPGVGEDSVREILSSKKIFPTNVMLSAFVRPFVELRTRPKESRERVVRRLLRLLETQSQRQSTDFRRTLEEYVKRHGTESDFVSRWTKIIRDL